MGPDMRMGHATKSVLIVDDSPAIRHELRQEFTVHGFTCAEAENGFEAIERARISHPGLIVLDLSMPVMNGLQSAPKLRQLLPQTPIILYTSFADALSPAEVYATGITAFVAKSEPVAVLMEKAEKLLREADL
jgi:CheY-like chemotaxis protein